MLYLLTGSPGSGKTLHMVSELNRNKDLKDRLLFVDGIPELDKNKIKFEEMPEGCSGENWHEWLPDGAILVIDEAQRYFRTRSNGSKVPENVAAIEMHRHRGQDLFFITQHPRLLDINVKSFVYHHKHFGKNQLGMRRMFAWYGCKNPDNQSDVRDATASKYKLDKSAFSLYKSAEVHTKIKTKVNIWFYLFPIILIFVLLMGWRTYSHFQNDIFSNDEISDLNDEYDSHIAELGTAEAAQSSQDEYHYDEVNQKLLTAEDFRPEMDGKPWTAPAYKSLNQDIKTMPFPKACVSSSDNDTCNCYTEQATIIRDIDKGLCLDFAENGIYNPYLAAGESLPAYKEFKKES